MKTITLNNDGVFCLVDDDDYDWLIQWRWSLYNYRGKQYARRTATRNGVESTWYMHREIAKRFIPGRTRKRNLVDHRHSNGLDNRRSELKWVTPRENRLNHNGCSWRHMTDFPDELRAN